MYQLVIKYEEAYLEEKFRDVYTSYKLRVRRWLYIEHSSGIIELKGACDMSIQKSEIKLDGNGKPSMLI